ncbi:MAG TPA: family 16 glycoside hydrolase [Gemmataceae bacterium]|nr:family 16 glycoside hydrolase [Gemmataceae bacterium]
MRLLLCPLFLFAATAVAADDFKPEPGFELLLKGDALDGWKTKAAAKKESEKLDGKAEAFGGRFKLKNGELTIDPKVKGDVTIETAKEFGGDVTIKFEFNPGKGCNNDLFFRGQKFDIKSDIKGYKEDAWNEFEITLVGTKAEFKCNGELARMANTKVEKSVFGIRAEFGPIQIRKLRVKGG